MHPHARFGLVIAGLVLVAACGTSATPSPSANANDGGTDAALPPTAVPSQHRPTGESCPTTRAANPPSPPATGSACSADADCTAGTNGRCFAPPIGGSGKGNLCSYDACATDADCGAPRVCACRNSANYDANTCFNGNCRTDSDCGARGFCSPSLVTLGNNCIDVPAGSVGYFCHVAGDECTDDADCKGGSGLGQCSFDVTALHWKCYQARCTG